MGAQGTATLDFGAFPGAADASVTVTGQAAILSGSLIEAWILPADTTDHTAGEHIIDPPIVIAANIVAGTGFTIYGTAPNADGGDGIGGGVESGSTNPRTSNPVCYGQWNIAWVWN